jgi:hypothetical protein
MGERLYPVTEWHGRWFALIGWTAAYRCRSCDAWIDWADDQRQRLLRLATNNACFSGFAGPTPRTSAPGY